MIPVGVSAVDDIRDECVLTDSSVRNNLWYCPRSAPPSTGSVRQLCRDCRKDYSERYMWQSSSRQGVIDQKACTSEGGALYCTVRYRCYRCSTSYPSRDRYLESDDGAFFWDQKTCSEYSMTDPPTKINSGTSPVVFCDRYFKESGYGRSRSVDYMVPGALNLAPIGTAARTVKATMGNIQVLI